MFRPIRRRTALASLGLGCLLTLTLPAIAAQSQNRVTVKFADLALDRPAGAAALYARIRNAARQVCEPMDTRPLAAYQLEQRCMSETIERAVASVNVPALTSYHLAKTGRAVILAKLD
jgi:UrcA family protein